MSLSGGDTPQAVHHVHMALCHLLSVIENLHPRAAADLPVALSALSDLADRLVWILGTLECPAAEATEQQKLRDRIGRALTNLSSASAGSPSAASRHRTAPDQGRRPVAVRVLLAAAQWMLQRSPHCDPTTVRLLRIAADRLRPAQDAQPWRRTDRA